MRTVNLFRRAVLLAIALVTAGPAIELSLKARAEDAPKAAQTQAGAQTPRVVAITARRFEFTPKEITLKKGETVTLRLTTEDVTHGFFMKSLGIDAAIEPGQPTDVTITPQATGSFTTICDHFCGEGHGNMHMTIVVE